MKTYPIQDVVVLGAGSAGLMTAILCKTFLKNLNLNVKIVQSGQVPILGVGEGTTEHIQEFLRHAGIDVSDFIKGTKATLKAGVLFKDWLYDGHEYWHSLRVYHVHAEHDLEHDLEYASPHFHMGMPIGGYACYIAPEIDDRSHSELSGNVDGQPLQYHFNNFALNEYLREKCKELGIEIVDDYIEKVDIDVDFNIKAIVGKQRHEADFFFDCSGFKRRLINEYQPKFVDYSDQLIVDRALFFPYKTVDNPVPMTLAKAMKYGWFWQAPTQDRTGNGYVYSSKHCTPEMALEEIRAMGYDLPDDAVNNVKEFTSGHIKNAWTKNCVAIGIASSFFEPLEAAALSTGVLQTLTVLDYLHSYDPKCDSVQRMYNRVFEQFYKNSFDFIRIHYITGRTDTSFWKEYSNKPLPQDLWDRLNLFKNRPATWVEQDLPAAFVLYGPDNFMQVLSGLELIDKEKLQHYIHHKGMATKLHGAMLKIEHMNQASKRNERHEDILNSINSDTFREIKVGYRS